MRDEATGDIRVHSRCPLCNGTLVVRYHGVADRLGTSAARYSLHECTACGLGLINPAPTGNLSRFYPQQYLSQEQAGTGANGIVSWAERAYRYNQYAFDFGLLERASGFEINGVDSYVDIGCGSGERVTYASARGCKRSVGIDRYEFGKHHSRGAVELVTTEITEFRPPERFRVASMFHVLEHVEDPVGVLTHVRRSVLSDNGVLVIQVPNYRSVERRLLRRRWFGLDAPRHLFHFDTHTARMVVESAGFEVLDIFVENAPLHPVTLVPSIIPALDVQRIWTRSGSAYVKLIAQVLWAFATVVAIPVAWVENKTGTASMLTVVARPASTH